MPEADRKPNHLDWIGVAIIAVLAAETFYSALVTSPTFEVMFQDFGSKQSLPGFTKLFLSPWPGLVVGLLSLACVVPSFIRIWKPRPGPALSRSLLFVGWLMPYLFAKISTYALYLPIHSLAGAIQA